MCTQIRSFWQQLFHVHVTLERLVCRVRKIDTKLRHTERLYRWAA